MSEHDYERSPGETAGGAAMRELITARVDANEAKTIAFQALMEARADSFWTTITMISLTAGIFLLMSRMEFAEEELSALRSELDELRRSS
jgi:hypothetical protein